MCTPPCLYIPWYELVYRYSTKFISTITCTYIHTYIHIIYIYAYMLYIHVMYICMYYFLSFTIFIVVCDGYFQYFDGQNILGFPKYRPDRISGFFNDDLILGSYLLRILPILLGLTLFFKDRTKNIFVFAKELWKAKKSNHIMCWQYIFYQMPDSTNIFLIQMVINN